MVAKVVGLATGVFVGSLAVWAFNEWRDVSDEDRLTSALVDHCLPYVLSGARPFVGQGRAVGVYDNVETHSFPHDGGAAVIFDDRFVANWGETQHPPLRVCMIDSRATWAPSGALAVREDGVMTQMQTLLAPLGDMVPDEFSDTPTESASGDIQVIGWRERGTSEDRGNTVSFVRDGSGISSVLVRRDLSDDQGTRP